MFSVIMMRNQNKRKVFQSIQDKMTIETSASMKMSHEYGISRDMIRGEYDFLSNFGNRGEHMQYKNRKGLLNEDVEKCLHTWQQQTVGNPLTNSSQQEKAIKICDGYGSTLFFGSRNWLRIIKNRYMAQSYRQKANEDKAARIFVNNSTTVNSKEEEEKIEEEQRKIDAEYMEFEKKLKKERMLQEGKKRKYEEQLIQNSKLNFIEKKKGDLNTLEQIIKKYADDDETVIIMGKTIRRILENKGTIFEG
ncbi:uncharacterized protein LOC116415240 [Apis florea]|uniref:uncharacterized protein LOC116415240 n=1 Tax=Apis florea TaxID=7463 RepID=UPI0012FEE5DB|nr:uncharacterized protein LOC116415240 [Apis florea]